MERQMLKDGSPHLTILTQELESTVHAAKRWIFGKPTHSPKLTLFILVLFPKEELLSAKVMKNVVTESIVMMVSATRMVATSLPTAGVITNSTERDLISPLILPRSLL
jgi:hypothetical protein